MPLHWKKQLANAHHEHRKTLNKVAELESRLASAAEANLTLTAQRQDLENKLLDIAEKLAMVQAEAGKQKKYRPLTDTELLAVASVVTLEALPGTPARLRVLDCLIDDLTYRGVLPPKEP